MNDDDNDNNNNNEYQQRLHQHLIFLSFLEKQSELPSYVKNKIVEEKIYGRIPICALLAKVRIYIQELFFQEDDELLVEEGANSILDTDWYNYEEKVETAIRLFPDILSEKKHGMYPIQRISMRHGEDDTYNLRRLSLIPLVTKLGIELHPFDKQLRLFNDYIGMNILHLINCYYSEKNNENNELLDDCFLIILNQLREFFRKEDIRRYIGNVFSSINVGYFSEKVLRHFIDWDPISLSIPCQQPGNEDSFLPIHWSISRNDDTRQFNLVLEAGLKYFPEKVGFVFFECTQQKKHKKVFTITPFQLACNKYGKEQVTNEVVDRLLVSAVIDESTHLDDLYVLLHSDPTTALLRLQQQQQLQIEKGQTNVMDIVTVNSNINYDVTNTSTFTSKSSSMMSSKSNSDDTQSSKRKKRQHSGGTSSDNRRRKK
jgi:hypothetical protein